MGWISRIFRDKFIYYYAIKRVLKNRDFITTEKRSRQEMTKSPIRSQIINFFIEYLDAKTYLEIGVRNPRYNFAKIRCEEKYSIDPGVEFKENPVDFKMTSDDFFNNLKNDKLSLDSSKTFDVIFIDGLHLANQVERDITHSLEVLNENGVIVLHDCNPPTIHHARENYSVTSSPAGPYWNGTTWKAYYKYRHHKNLYSITFDSDWGVAIISKQKLYGFNNIASKITNPFFEYDLLKENRKEHLNLQNFEKWSREFARQNK